MGKVLSALCVDDDPDSLDLLEYILSREGVKVFKAKNGLEAKEHLHNSSQFDVVICDVFMPRMGGIDLCKFIDRQLPVLLISGKDEFPMDFDLSDAFIDKTQLKNHLIKATYKAMDHWHLTRNMPIAA